MSRNHPQTSEDRRRWKRTRRAAFERDSYRCRECGKAGRLEAHHEPPLDRGGDLYDLGGILTLCRDCHIRKTAEENTRPGRLPWLRFRDELLSKSI